MGVMSVRVAVSFENRLMRLAANYGFEIVEHATLDGKPPCPLVVPSGLHENVAEFLRKSHPEVLYAHQARVVEMAIDGSDVCLATPTASGKSLVFMAVTAHLLKQNPSKRILALYPAKALIQDQLDKWRDMLAPLGLELGYVDYAVSMQARAGILRGR